MERGLVTCGRHIYAPAVGWADCSHLCRPNGRPCLTMVPTPLLTALRRQCHRVSLNLAAGQYAPPPRRCCPARARQEVSTASRAAMPIAPRARMRQERAHARAPAREARPGGSRFELRPAARAPTPVGARKHQAGPGHRASEPVRAAAHLPRHQMKAPPACLHLGARACGLLGRLLLLAAEEAHRQLDDDVETRPAREARQDNLREGRRRRRDRGHERAESRAGGVRGGRAAAGTSSRARGRPAARPHARGGPWAAPPERASRMARCLTLCGSGVFRAGRLSASTPSL